jgi:hypothetical protein
MTSQPFGLVLTRRPFVWAGPRYAEAGFRVFRIKPHLKKPLDRWVNGPEVATSDIDEVKRRSRRNATYNIGIAIGNGLVVVDQDVRHGGQRPEWAIPTCEARTPGGLHLYYRTDGHVPNSVGAIAPGVDVRGDGGMVVAPPSRTAAGVYEWITPEHTRMAFLPADRFRAVNTAAGRPVRAGARKRPEEIHNGERHDQLLRWAGHFAAEYELDVAVDLVWQFNARLTSPLPEDEVQSIIDWIDRKEAATAA